MRLLLLISLLGLVSLSYQQTASSTAATTTTTTATTRVPCTNTCTHVYRPVCGMYNGRRRTFQNRCILRANKRCARSRGTLATLGIRFLFTGRCNARGVGRRAGARRRRVG